MSAAQLMLPANRAFNSNGLAVPGACARLYTTGTLTPAAFYSDAALSVSLGASITANGAGRFDPLPYQDDATAFRLRIEDAAGAELDDIDPFYFGQNIYSVSGAIQVATRAILATLASTATSSVYLTETGREGAFVWSSANNSAKVTADTQQGIYVAPSTDTTGASGAWVRKYTGATNVKWFGATGDGTTNDYAAIQCVINTVIAAGGGTVYFPAGGFYLVNTGLLITSTVDALIPIRLEGGGATYLKTNSAIDILTISCTGGSGNTRFVAVNNLGFNANHASARGLVLSNASYNQFTNLDMLGGGTAITCGSAVDNRNIGNQFDNIRITQPGNGILISGLYNLFTNIEINEGLTGAYAIQIDGQYCVVDGFVARGANGTGGTATVLMSSTSTYSIIANGTVIDSYAVGVHVQGADGQKVKGVSIINSQTHGLQLNGCSSAEIDVTLAGSSLATADTYSHINCLNTPTSCTVRAQFAGTQALLDINEASGTNNIWHCGTLPNGKTISGTSSVVVSAGNVRAASYNVGATLVLNSSGVLQAAAVPAFTGDITTPGASLATTIAADAVTYAKLQQVAASSLVGNATGSTANATGITLAGGLAFSGSTLTAAGALTPTSVAIGSGTALTKAVVYTPSITPASVAADTVAEQTFTVTGLTTADTVFVNPPSIANATGVAGVRVSAADTLAIRFNNPTAGALTPTSGTYRVLAFRS